MKEAAKEIWSTYLDTSSSYQINVDSKSRSHCKELLDNPINNMFESAQLHVSFLHHLTLYFNLKLLLFYFLDIFVNEIR
jgi:hypothetical protein